MTDQPVYLDYAKFYASLDAGITDISAYVVGDTACQWGMSASAPPTADGLAGVGAMTLTLNNASGYFGGVNLLAGWGEGTEIYLELCFEGFPFRRFRGRVQSCPWRPAEWGGNVRVTVNDWIQIALDFPLVGPAIGTDQTADQVITTINSGMAIPPAATDLDTGVVVFSSTFDGVRDRKAWAYSEYSKVQRSEFGRIYLIKDRVNGETLVFENQAARYGWRPLDTVKYPARDGALLLRSHTYTADDFFDSVVGTGLSINTASKLTGENSLAVAITDTTARYGSLTVAGDPQQMVISSKVRVSELTMANNDTFTTRGAYSGGGTLWFQMQLIYLTVGGYMARAVLRTDAAAFVSTSNYAIADGDEVKIICNISTAVGANNGSIALYINGVSKETLSGRDNDTAIVAELRVGAPTGLDAGTSGTIYYDDIWWSLTDGGAYQADVDFERQQLATPDGRGLLLSTTATVNAEFANTMLSDGSEEVTGGEIINYLTLTAHPTKTSGTVQILFNLDEPVPIASGQTIAIRGGYANPSGGNPCNATGMITPVATTDFLADTVRGGGGTDITASIVIGPIYRSESFYHFVYNGSASSGWINFYQCRGYGIYRDNPIYEVITDDVSIARRGERTATLDQVYNKNLTEGSWIGASIVEQFKDPRPNIKTLTYCPNTSRMLMFMFLNVDIGYLIAVDSDMANVDEWFYVQNVKFILEQGGVIKSVTYALKPALNLQ